MISMINGFKQFTILHNGHRTGISARRVGQCMQGDARSRVYGQDSMGVGLK